MMVVWGVLSRNTTAETSLRRSLDARRPSIYVSTFTAMSQMRHVGSLLIEFVTDESNRLMWFFAVAVCKAYSCRP
jgi:hypothetical protein